MALDDMHLEAHYDTNTMFDPFQYTWSPWMLH